MGVSHVFNSMLTEFQYSLSCITFIGGFVCALQDFLQEDFPGIYPTELQHLILLLNILPSRVDSSDLVGYLSTLCACVMEAAECRMQEIWYLRDLHHLMLQFPYWMFVIQKYN